MEFWPPAWVLLILAIIYGLYLLGTWPHDRFKNLGIPFDKPLPFIGNMGPFVFRQQSFGDLFVHMYRKYKGSSLIGFYQMANPLIIVKDPELIKMITVKDFDHFTDHITPIKEDDDPLFGKFLFALQGDRWKQMRSTLSPAFTSSKMKTMFSFVSQCGEQLGDYLQKKCEDAGGVLQMDMKDFFTRYTNDVIATAAFGIHVDSLQQPNNEFYMMGKEAVNFGGFQIVKFLGFMVSRRMMKFLNLKFVTNAVNDFFQSLVKNTMIHREKENIVRPDMIHLLMEARKGTLKSEADDGNSDVKVNGNNQKFVWSDEDMTAQAFLFFVAGFDTASTHLCFLTHLLAEQPRVLRRVQQELDSILHEDGGKLTYDGLQRMKYTDMVISEALRLWPPAVISDRQCVKAYTIPATKTSPSIRLNVGDNIALPILAIHRDPENFPDPDHFDPERFSEENKNNIKPFTYLPFGAGPRICIGMRFALMETKIALASVLSRFDVEFIDKTPKKLVLNKKTFNMGVEGGFWLGIKPRTRT